MQTMYTLQDFAREIQRVDAAKRDYVTPTSKMWMYDDITLNIGKDPHYGINDVAHQQISDKLDIPKRYYDRIRTDMPELLATNVNAHFRKRPTRNLVRILDGNVRAFLSDRYNLLYDNMLVATTVFPIMVDFPEMNMMSLALTDKRIYIKAVLPSLEREVKVGHPVQAGIIISNSEVGMGAFSVERMMYILSCTNGVTRGETLWKAHLGQQLDSDLSQHYQRDTVKAKVEAFRLETRDTVRLAFDETLFDADAKQLTETTERKIPTGQIDETVKNVTKNWSLAQDTGQDILSNLVEGGDLSQWGLSNAVTAKANQSDNFDAVIELQRIGGKILDLSPDQWKIITSEN